MPSLSRRSFLGILPAASLGAFDALAAPERGHARIADIRTMVLQGPRTYTLVKVISDAGVYGIGEGYGSPEPGIKEGILDLRPYFIGKDPLQIEANFNGLAERTNASPSLLRAASAIEVALWDLAGKLLEQPVSTLLGGRNRDRVRVYCDDGPANMLDRTNCNDWADKMKADPAGWTAYRVAPPQAAAKSDPAADPANRILTSHALREIRQAFEYLRDAIGGDADLIVRCPQEYDLRAAIQLTEAIEPVKPLWLADPLPAGAGSNARLAAASKVPIACAEYLSSRREFKRAIFEQTCDIVQLDIRNTGGLLESRKIGDLAELFDMPLTAHNTGSAIHTMATVQWAASVRDFMVAGCSVGRRNWMDDVILHDGPVVAQGYIAVPQKPGLGIELNPDVVRANLAQGEKYWD